MRKETVDDKFPNLLSNEDIGRIEAKINELENVLNPKSFADDVGIMAHAQSRIQDRASTELEIKKRKITLTKHSPKPFASAAQANEAYRWCKQFEAWAKDAAPNKKQTSMPYPKGCGTPLQDTDFDQAVRKQQRWNNPKIQAQVQIFRHLMRRLDPHNPHAGRL